MDADDTPAGRFRRLCTTSCPSYGEVLHALAAELGATGAAPPDLDRLDDQARLLFGAAGQSARDRARRLSAVAFGTLGYATTLDGGVSELLLPDVVAARRGHPAVVAAAVAELGRRAGMRTVVARCATSWYAGTGDAHGVLLIEVGPHGAGAAPGQDGPGKASPNRSPQAVCAHALAREVLGLVRARSGGDAALRSRAAALHAELP
jgi:hypothetical protein